MSKILELFEYSSPLGLWRGFLYENKLCCLSRDTEKQLLQFAKSKKYSVQKILIPHVLRQELDLYFQGKLHDFKFPLHLLDGSPFEKEVWNCLLKIPYGETRSYAWVAQNIKNPKAVRAVGSANGKNRLALVIPCHRVIRSNGGLGGYSAGLDLKKKLLKIEGIEF